MQVIRGCRKAGKPVRRRRTKALQGCPQKRGVILSILNLKPKKPNSANRAAVKVRLSTGDVVFAYIPGIGHNLQPHNKVLIAGGRRQDIPGINLEVVRGAKGYDCNGVVGRKSSRSKYGQRRT